mmetsp:Transcript_46199/g.86479  ORF Transcript_46199/g.86479 Transcript_46199/m.86479 type:complete len:223 (-) Transcript_46199:664-1332(-)
MATVAATSRSTGCSWCTKRPSTWTTGPSSWTTRPTTWRTGTTTWHTGPTTWCARSTTRHSRCSYGHPALTNAWSPRYVARSSRTTGSSRSNGSSTKGQRSREATGGESATSTREATSDATSHSQAAPGPTWATATASAAKSTASMLLSLVVFVPAVHTIRHQQAETSGTKSCSCISYDLVLRQLWCHAWRPLDLIWLKPGPPDEAVFFVWHAPAFDTLAFGY